jgi:hypothetical protein
MANAAISASAPSPSFLSLEENLLFSFSSSPAIGPASSAATAATAAAAKAA